MDPGVKQVVSPRQTGVLPFPSLPLLGNGNFFVLTLWLSEYL